MRTFVLAGTNVPAHYFLPANAMIGLTDGEDVGVGDVYSAYSSRGFKNS